MAQILVGHHDVVGQYVSREVGKLWVPGAGTTLGWIDNGKLIAGVTFIGYDGVNVWMDCAAEPGSRWLDRRGLWAIFHYVFEQLRCTRVSAMIPESNDKSIKLVEQAGFTLEASLARAAPGGEDMKVFRMFREDCRWLKRAGK